MKIALVSHHLPPTSSGQAVVIHRMLRDVSPESYCLISPQLHESGPGAGSWKLPGTYHHLPPPVVLKRGHKLGLKRLREWLNLPLGVIHQARSIARIISSEKCDAVVACTGDVTHLPASYLASLFTGVRFYAYVFDHYSYREWFDPVASFWARRFERRLMKGATKVITPNETLRNDLREKFGIEALVIHNSLDLKPYETNGMPVSQPQTDGIRIIYTGDVYEAHYDAFRNLIAAIELLGCPEIKLHLYTDRPLEAFADYGIQGPIVQHAHLSPDDIPRIQMEGDALFLPLAFKSPYPDLVRTSATTKLGEYLAARRPVIVHAPADSFLATYVRQHECGVVVDRLDPSVLAREIQHILDDASLRDRLAARAWERAVVDFDIAEARAKFWSLLTEKKTAS